jgi:hypothetical protein
MMIAYVRIVELHIVSQEIAIQNNDAILFTVPLNNCGPRGKAVIDIVRELALFKRDDQFGFWGRLTVIIQQDGYRSIRIALKFVKIKVEFCIVQ